MAMDKEKLKLNTPIPIEHVDFRIQSINKGKYATILAYKDARVDMNRLDAVVGTFNWQRDHKEVRGVVYCGVGIKTVIAESDRAREEWSWKWDAGAESFTDKEKGEASDSFKRACFNWGIGRELYDYPVISVKLNDDEVYESQGKFKQAFGFSPNNWNWISEFDKDNKLILLAAKDQSGKVRFVYDKRKK